MRRLNMTVAAAWLLAIVAGADDTGYRVMTADNPSPEELPTLAVWQRGPELLVAASFPNVPNLMTDSWCYEAAMDCVGIAALDGGRIELRHRDRTAPIDYVTTITPRAGAVEFEARPELVPGAPGSWPAELPMPNMCWQLKRAPSFCSAPDPYPDFVARCFIFTDKGLTYLSDTRRERMLSRPADAVENNPPWVQMYVGKWQSVPETTADWHPYSLDQYVTTVIGTVSRDRAYLAAIATESAPQMRQVWHDCMHNNAYWTPVDAPPDQQRWRVIVYGMENDPEKLLERVKADFPNIRVPE